MEHLDHTFIVVCWPESQLLMDIPGFKDNVVLINEEPLLEEYGSSAYLVRKEWLIKNTDYEEAV